MRDSKGQWRDYFNDDEIAGEVAISSSLKKSRHWPLESRYAMHRNPTHCTIKALLFWGNERFRIIVSVLSLTIRIIAHDSQPRYTDFGQYTSIIGDTWIRHRTLLLPIAGSSAKLLAMNKRFYITTAIDYVNGQPHLGHAYEKVIADVIARARRSQGQETFFLTGLDEHGQKVQQAAQAEGKDPQTYCDALAKDWKAFAQKLELTNDDFIRTTDARHKEIVQASLAKVNADGHVYKKTYEGFYSTKEETFLTEKDRRPDGTFDPSYGEVITLQEENYFFKLTEHQQWLIDYIEANPSFVQPDYRRNEVLGFLKNNTLQDLCISRPAARLNWGIPIPFDTNYVTYVWFGRVGCELYITIPAAHGDKAVTCRQPSPLLRPLR